MSFYHFVPAEALVDSRYCGARFQGQFLWATMPLALSQHS